MDFLNAKTRGTAVKHVFLAHLHKKTMEKQCIGMQKLVLCEQPLKALF